MPARNFLASLPISVFGPSLTAFLELGDPLVPLRRPDEELAELVVDDLALREARQSGPRFECRRQIVLVEEADRLRDKCVDVAGLLPGGPGEEPLGGDLATLLLEAGALLEELFRVDGMKTG